MDISALEKNIKFEADFRQYYECLCSYAITFLKDETSSEDIVQEVFIKIWEQREDLIGSEGLKFYLFTSVRNNCLTALSKNKKTAVFKLNDDEVPDVVPIVLNHADAQADPKILIAKAMEQLPSKCREVFMLSRLSGHTYQQIADGLGISVKTVENQMGKAIRIMKVFAKENGIYFWVAFWFGLLNDQLQSLVVIIEKWF